MSESAVPFELRSETIEFEGGALDGARVDVPKGTNYVVQESQDGFLRRYERDQRATRDGVAIFSLKSSLMIDPVRFWWAHGARSG